MANTDAQRVPPGQRLVQDFPVLHAGSIAHVRTESFAMALSGLVQPQEKIDWDGLLAYPSVEQTCDIHCVTGWSKLDTTWKGVRVSTLLEHFQISPEAKHCAIHAAAGWTTNLPLEHLLRDNVLLAYEYEGLPLSAEHGGPVRLLVPDLYLWKSAKWLEGIEFTAQQRLGFWETRGYHEFGGSLAGAAVLLAPEDTRAVRRKPSPRRRESGYPSQRQHCLQTISCRIRRMRCLHPRPFPPRLSVGGSCRMETRPSAKRDQADSPRWATPRYRQDLYLRNDPQQRG